MFILLYKLLHGIFPRHINNDILAIESDALVALKFVIAVKLDCELTIEVLIKPTSEAFVFVTKVICDVLCKLHCPIRLVLIQVFKLVHEKFPRQVNIPLTHVVPKRDGIFSFSSYANCIPEAFVECAKLT